MTDEQSDLRTSIPTSSLRSDEPIRSSEEDRLSRAALVEVIARHILSTDARVSIVIAVNAPWGAGKSSFLNLLERRLKAAREEHSESGTDQPSVIRFNPWHFRNIEQLVKMFFGELVRVIGTSGAIRQKIGKLLNTVGSVVTAASSIAPVGAPLGTLVQSAGSVLGAEKSLYETKTELDELLEKLEQRVVVFVDDIDRLEPDVTKLIFRMVRLNGNLPNVTYVLAFDRLVVERNLDDENGIRGRDYLEKIVQVSFDIPEPEAEAIDQIFQDEISAVLQSIETRPLDDHRYANLYFSGFKEHFRTIRHVKRYANGLRLTLPPVAQEVDLVDFLAIELIRVFHPEVYGEMVRSKDMLAFSGGGDEARVPAKAVKEWAESLCSKASCGFEDSVRSLLCELFPTLSGPYTNFYRNASDPAWRRDGRVCAPDVFDKFFLLAVPAGEVSEVELAAFVSGVADLDKTAAALRTALERGNARHMIERLMDSVDRMAEEQLAPLVEVMLDFGDCLLFEQRGMYDTAEMLATNVAWRCLRRIAPEEERHSVILKSLEAGRSLFALCNIASLAEPERNSEPLLHDRGLWESVKHTCVERISGAAADGSLWQRKGLPSILPRWMSWSSEDDVRAVINRRVDSDEYLLSFIGCLVRKYHSLGGTDKVARVRRMIDTGLLRRLLDMETVKRRLRTIGSVCGKDSAVANDLLKVIDESGRLG